MNFAKVIGLRIREFLCRHEWQLKPYTYVNGSPIPGVGRRVCTKCGRHEVYVSICGIPTDWERVGPWD